jgi:hypothetical protein
MRILKILAGVCLTAALSACVTSDGSYSITKFNSEQKSISHKQNYAFLMSEEIVRAGSKSQRFELRHGDCGSDSKYSDCNNDRGRTERTTEINSFLPYVDQVVWVGYSVYLPNDFANLHPSSTMIGQVKLTGWRNPIWDVYASNGQLEFVANASGQFCRLGSINKYKGKWTDIQIGFDFALNKGDNQGAFNGQFAEIWLNGRKSSCRIPRAGFSTEYLNASSNNDLHFAWGIYNSYISRWLSSNKTKNPKVVTFKDVHIKEGNTNVSATNDPWSVDWGVQVPTQVVYYDEIRVGRTRESVDVTVAKSAID